MDFIDFNTFEDPENLPLPQPALSLPISANMETIGRKFSNLNSFTRSLLKNATGESDGTQEGENGGFQGDLSDKKEQLLADKYAAISLSMLDLDLSADDAVVPVASAVASTTGERSAGPNSGARNNLSSRLSRVLSNPVSDASIREIFTLLEQKVLSTSEVVEPGIAGTMSRKALRSDIESDLIKSQSLVLKEYQNAFKSLHSLETKLQKLNVLYKDIKTKVDDGYGQTKDFNLEVSELMNRKKEIALKKSLLTSFRKNFTLSEYEEHLLSAGEISGDFFAALANAERIHENCSILLSSDNPKLGLSIMAKMTTYINKSIERIVLFCSKTFGNLYSLNTKSRLQTLHICLKYLSRKPSYLNSVMSGFTESRSRVLVDDLLSQISGNLDKNDGFEAPAAGGSSIVSGSSHRRSSTSRPILLSAHDPVRFIGDLLAYVHSVVVNEIETIDNIFTNEPVFKSMASKLLLSILGSLSKPVTSRIDLILSSETKISTIHSIRNLLDLYIMMYEKQLHSALSQATQKAHKNTPTDLIAAIQHLSKNSVDRVFHIIQNKLLTIRNSNLAQMEINSLLQPPEWIIEFYLDILPVLDNVSSTTLIGEVEVKRYMNVLVDEPIEVFELHCRALRLNSTVGTNSVVGLDHEKRDQLILKGNFLDLILSKITPIIILNDKVLELHEKVNDISTELTTIQTQVLYANCGFSDYANIVNMICPFTDDFFDVSIYEPILENQMFNAGSVAECNLKIQDFLPTALMDAQQAFLKLNSPITFNEVVTNSSVEFVKFYLKFGLVVEEHLKERLFAWSDLEVATLLGVETVYTEEKSKMEFS